MEGRSTLHIQERASQVSMEGAICLRVLIIDQALQVASVDLMLIPKAKRRVLRSLDPFLERQKRVIRNS
jgi:hypothetical protein